MIVLIAATVTACGKSESNDPPRDLVLRIGVPEGAVPGTEVGVQQLVSTFTLEGLTQVSVDGRALPRLAESWSWEGDGLKLRIKLRPGVKFHDGTRFASEVAANILHEAVSRRGNRALYPSLASITAVRPQGDDGLLIELSQRSAFLPEDLDLPLGLRVGAETIGTGAYRVAARSAEEIVLEGFDEYYLSAPRIRRVVIRPFATIRTAWTSLLRSDVDMVTDVPPDVVEFIRTDDVQVLSFARRYQFLVAFNSAKPPFTSPGVRRALNLAVDREALIRNVLRGQAEPANGPLWPKHWAYDTSVAPYVFDLGLAASLLDAAGFRRGAVPAQSGRPDARLRFTCLIPTGFSVLERIALEVQRQLYEADIDMQFEVVPFGEYDARIRNGRFEAVLIDLISGPTFERPYIFWRSAKAFKGLNAFGFENPEAERLFELLGASTDNEATVRSATRRLQRVLMDDPPALFLAWNERSRAVRSEFRVVQDDGRDPLFTIWQWTENPDRQTASIP